MIEKEIEFEQNEVHQNNNHNGECDRQLGEWKDRALRLAADIENMRRRSHDEQQLRIIQREKKIFLDLLPIIDNFERALASNQNVDVSGILLIHGLFQKFLLEQGLTEIKEMQQFDPELHEAISQINDATKPSGTIVQIFEKGYRLHDHVLRHAKVAVIT